MPLLSPLYKDGMVPRQGQVITVFGQPGAMKSTFVEWYINAMNVTSVYFSADTDAQDAITRLAGMRTSIAVKKIAAMIKSDPDAAEFVYSQIEDSKIQWVFDSGPTLEDIFREIDAYVELYDEYPCTMVIDNAMNVEGQTEEEQGGLRLVFKELHRFAHDTGITIFIVHHAREEGDSALPSPRSAMQGKVAQLPEIILSVAVEPETCQFRMAVVKNRSGESDASGKRYHKFQAKPEFSQFDEWREPFVTVMQGGVPFAGY